jgi:hypothetical protein
MAENGILELLRGARYAQKGGKAHSGGPLYPLNALFAHGVKGKVRG